jgi:hypothetical protein
LKKQLAICVGLLLLGFGTARLAEAQTVYAGPGVSDPALPPYAIMSIVRSTGLAPLTRPMRRGPYYVLVAVDRLGREMRVVVDAQLGDIVNLRPALAAGSYGPEVTRSYGPELVRPNTGGPAFPDSSGSAGSYGQHPGGDPALTPPRSIPNAHAVNAPSSVAAPPSSPSSRVAGAETGLPALPPSPPLPRPRPKLALNETPGIMAPAAAAPAATPAGSRPAPAAAPPSPAPDGSTDPANIE